MRVSGRTANAIAEIVTGDKRLSPYRRGYDLVCLFNEYGFDDVYGPNFPSRGPYTQQKLQQLNGTPQLARLLKEILHPAAFPDDMDPQVAIDHINRPLRFDGYEITSDTRGVPVIRTVDGSMVDLPDPISGSDDDARRFLDEQREKCEQKLREGDYDGAITNARSLAERVLLDIERAECPDAQDYDGDLIKLYKRVQRLLKLEPSRPDVDTALKQTLVGLSSVVAGIAGISNKMGDRHARRYAPQRRHAVLVVDSAKTLASFLISTYRERRPGPAG